ncbi:hypothetical protein C8R45DRAFT_937400 [Mycena sanguinolenta]|nr:hypothetical protein C8R45DRAFT_937400 [Mycena sanguinolenta]
MTRCIRLAGSRRFPGTSPRTACSFSNKFIAASKRMSAILQFRNVDGIGAPGIQTDTSFQDTLRSETSEISTSAGGGSKSKETHDEIRQIAELGLRPAIEESGQAERALTPGISFSIPPRRLGLVAGGWGERNREKARTKKGLAY